MSQQKSKSLPFAQASHQHHHVDDSHVHDSEDDDNYHDDGHGYHSEPVPKQITAPFKETFRQRRKSNDPQEKKSDYKKPTGMEKKPYAVSKDRPRYNNPFVDSDPFKPSPSFGTDQPKISGSTFDKILDFDPFLPPDILKSPSHRVSGTTSVPPIAQTKPYYQRNFKPKKNMPKKFRPTSKPKKFTPKTEMPNLAFDLDSGRVYDENSGKWYKLVADS